ncbi:hypothetical protein HK100_005390 [Physocladia obscura]|uniref:Dihydroxyacetone kinase n=1 Tax=Physocladia obscura TaxID=109957 RepID=A0AAD5T5U4_9FUNG|nr:hypothetical protein HK100_005390 [Physocladia obscura]
MKQLFSATNIVQEAIHGAVCNGAHPAIHSTATGQIVYRIHDDKNGSKGRNRVRIISGGGSGHEPAHAGFVGEGMLDAAVAGAVFASPSSAQVASALTLLSHNNSNNNNNNQNNDVLVIVKNYTGDKLAFGRAVERFNSISSNSARAKMLIVTDDCAIPKSRSLAGRRGLAGIILVYKIAGELVRRGDVTLERVYNLANQVSQKIGTVGMALRDDGKYEIGLGIHGEQGYSIEEIYSGSDLAKKLVDMILIPKPDFFSISLPQTAHLVVLINNLGSTTDLEMNAFQSHVLSYIKKTFPHLASIRVISGRLMTSLHMHGLSLTLFADPTDEMLELLDIKPAPECQWPGVVKLDMSLFYGTASTFLQTSTNTPTKNSAILKTGPILPAIAAETFQKCLLAAANALISAEPLLTKYDTIVGDGDCGHTMKSGGTALLKAAATSTETTTQISYTYPVSALHQISEIIENSMGGASGALYCILVDAAAGYLVSLNSSDKVNFNDWLHALEAGIDAVKRYGGAKAGDCTMIDSLEPLLASLQETGTKSTTKVGDWTDAVVLAVEKGVEKTAEMDSARAGRSSYIGAILSGTPDPGAVAVLVWVKAVLSVLKNAA